MEGSILEPPGDHRIYCSSLNADKYSGPSHIPNTAVLSYTQKDLKMIVVIIKDLCICIHRKTSTHIYKYIYIYMYTYMCTCIYTYTYTRRGCLSPHVTLDWPFYQSDGLPPAQGSRHKERLANPPSPPYPKKQAPGTGSATLAV